MRPFCLHKARNQGRPKAVEPIHEPNGGRPCQGQVHMFCGPACFCRRLTLHGRAVRSPHPYKSNTTQWSKSKAMQRQNNWTTYVHSCTETAFSQPRQPNQPQQRASKNLKMSCLYANQQAPQIMQPPCPTVDVRATMVSCELFWGVEAPPKTP